MLPFRLFRLSPLWCLPLALVSISARQRLPCDAYNIAHMPSSLTLDCSNSSKMKVTAAEVSEASTTGQRQPHASYSLTVILSLSLSLYSSPSLYPGAADVTAFATIFIQCLSFGVLSQPDGHGNLFGCYESLWTEVGDVCSKPELSSFVKPYMSMFPKLVCFSWCGGFLKNLIAATLLQFMSRYTCFGH